MKNLMKAAWLERLCGVREAGAYLCATAQPLVNQFTASKLNITLEEPLWRPGSELVPGTVIRKDPVVTVEAGSANCYLVVQVSQSDAAAWQAAGIEYGYMGGTGFVPGMLPGWIPVPESIDLWYREVDTAQMDQSFTLFDLVNVPEGVTQAQLQRAVGNELTVSAWAIQRDSFGGAEEALAQLRQAALCSEA